MFRRLGDYVCKMYHDDMRLWNGHVITEWQTRCICTVHALEHIYTPHQLNVIPHRADKQERGAVNKRNLKTNSNSTFEELNVAWQQKTLSDVRSNYTLQYQQLLERKSMLLTKTSTLHKNQEWPCVYRKNLYLSCSFFLYFSTVERERWDTRTLCDGRPKQNLLTA